MPSWLSGIVEHSIRKRFTAYSELAGRVLAEWDDLEARAGQVADEEWNRLMSEPGDAAADAGAIAACATEASQEYYDTMFPIGQAMTNLFTVGLFHLFEQQLVVLVRAMTTTVSVPGSIRGVFSILNGRLNIDIASSYAMAGRLAQLRLIVNVLKHAEGRSAETLRSIRPELFDHPAARGLPRGGSIGSTLIREPLAGEGIYVTRADYDAFATDIDAFWSMLMNDLDRTFA